MPKVSKRKRFSRLKRRGTRNAIAQEPGGGPVWSPASSSSSSEDEGDVSCSADSRPPTPFDDGSDDDSECGSGDDAEDDFDRDAAEEIDVNDLTDDNPEEYDTLLDAGAPFFTASLKLKKCAAMLALAVLRRRAVPAAADLVAEMFGFSASSIYSWRKQALSSDGVLVDSCRGVHPKTKSAIADDGVRSSIRAYIKENAVVLGRPNMRINSLRRFVNELLPPLGYDQVSEPTILRWVHLLGFQLRRLKGKIWVDGHDRPDVVEQRSDFLQLLVDDIWPAQPLYFHADDSSQIKHVDQLANITERATINPVGGLFLKPLPSERLVVYWQDETCFATHDFEKVAWLDEVCP